MRIIATCWVILTLTREVGHLKSQHNGCGQWFTPSVVGGTTRDLLSDGTSTQGALIKLKKKIKKKKKNFSGRDIQSATSLSQRHFPVVKRRSLRTMAGVRRVRASTPPPCLIGTGIKKRRDKS